MAALPNFDALKDLHDSANDLLHSEAIRREITQNQQQKWVDEISEAALRVLDSCGTTKDVLLLVKDHLHDLQATFRRISAGESSSTTENKFAAYHLQRKKLRKAMLKRLHSLKGMKNNVVLSSSTGGSELLLPPNDDDNNILLVVVKVLREVRVTTMSIVEALMSLMSMPSPQGRSNQHGLLAAKLTRMNSLSPWEKCDATALQYANRRLEAVEIATAELEMELESIFRRLIRTRVSLLNILTN